MKPDTQSVDKSIDRTVDVTKYIFHAPNPNQLLLITLLISIILGVILTFNLNDLGGNFESPKLISSIFGYGFIILGLPALISALISKPLAEKFGGRFYYRRAVLLAFIAMICFGIVLIICKVLTIFIKLDLTVILIFCYSTLLILRHTALVVTSNHSHLRSLPASMNHSLLGFAMIIVMPVIAAQVNAGSMLSPEYSITMVELMYMVGFSLIFLFTTILWIGITSRPFRANFGANGLELAAHGLGQFTEQTKRDIDALESFFDSFGNTIDTTIDTVIFKTRTGKFKAIIIVPGLHPGPFGYASGSNLPIKFAAELQDLSQNVMVFHGASTHDHNPVNSKELKKTVRRLKSKLRSKSLSFSANSSKLIRLKSATNSIQICAQILGNGILMVYTSSPRSTDDIDYDVGNKAILAAEQTTKLADTAIFIDSHNCLEKGIGSVVYGSKDSDVILELTKRSITSLNEEHGKSLSKPTRKKIRAGFANNNNFTIKEGIGPQGIQVLVIETPTPKQKAAYILIDGNNIIPTLREQILKTLRDLVDEAEVFTSDNHVVNSTMGGYNPIGLKGSRTMIISTIQELVRNAVQDLEEVEVNVDRSKVKNIKVFGEGNTLLLTTTINSTISIMRNSFFVCNTIAIFGCIMLYLLI